MNEIVVPTHYPPDNELPAAQMAHAWRTAAKDVQRCWTREAAIGFRVVKIVTDLSFPWGDRANRR
jgi:hypothetical protein